MREVARPGDESEQTQRRRPPFSRSPSLQMIALLQ